MICVVISSLSSPTSHEVLLDASDVETESIAKFSDGSLVEWLGHYGAHDQFNYDTVYNYQRLKTNGNWDLYHYGTKRYYICEAPTGELKNVCGNGPIAQMIFYNFVFDFHTDGKIHHFTRF